MKGGSLTVKLSNGILAVASSISLVTVAATAQAAPAPTPPHLPAGWRRLDAVARGLMAARALRSVAQGALAADFVLFLRALHWQPGTIGLLLTASSLAGGVLGLAVGPISDRVGRRPFLLIYQASLSACTLAVLADPRGWLLAVAAVVFGYGLGANGAAGPFAPAEQAWLARHVPASERGAVFSLNAAIGFWGMGVGSLIGGLVPRWAGALPGTRAYMPLFALTLALSVVNYRQIAALREDPPAGAQGRPPHLTGAPPPAAAGDASVSLPPAAEARVRRQENRTLALLVASNAVNAVGIGLFAPLLPYWFSARYGVGPGAIGSIYGLTFILTGMASIVTGQLVARIGLVRAIVWVRLAGVLMLLAMPLMPTFGWAAVLYAARSVLNRGSVGARQAFGVGIVRDQRRGLASSLNNVSWSLPGAIGPGVGGYLMALGSLSLPLYLAAAFQLAYAVLFGALFRRYEPAGTRRSPAAT